MKLTIINFQVSNLKPFGTYKKNKLKETLVNVSNKNKKMFQSDLQNLPFL